MFARRNLRRSLIGVVCLPLVLLGLLVVDKKQDLGWTDHFSWREANPSPQHRLSTPNEDTLQRMKRSIDQHGPSEFVMEKPQNLVPLDLYQQPSVPDLPGFRPITYPVIETKNLERLVHLDLKGAAPKLDYYQKLFPFLKQSGATGLLIEYEDMFPFTGRLAVVRHGLAYSETEIEQILQLARINGLTVMPLLQVYGHMEYVLKLKEFMHLREDRRYPQVITPCLEESYQLIFEMIDQFLQQHPSIPYLHMGCDEVYYRLVHPQCASLNFRDDGDLFIKHVTRVARYIKSKRPSIKLFVWHDMISQLLNTGYHNITELVQLVIPMVWAYVDDVKPWFDSAFWMRFSLFPEVWVASSFKGSSGETTTMSYIGHHQRNQQTWLEAMYIAGYRHRVNFTGIAVTGWSRYDHMLSLCELLPSSVPSLTYALQTIVYGQIDEDMNDTIAETLLGCNQMPLWERSGYATYVTCTFPGHELYELMYQYDAILRQYEETMAFVRLYVTDIHLRQNYIHYKRNQECLERLFYLEDQMIYFINAFQRICLEFFTADVGPEWLQTYFMRKFREVQYRLNFIERTLKTQTFWPPRPLPNNTAPIVVKRRNLTISSLLNVF